MSNQKKIGILTYHACYNYGACLQAYALQQTINKIAGSCEIIDYQSNRLININHPFSKVPKHPKEIIKLFNDFINNTLVLSPRCSNDEDVIRQSKQYNCIVCGSDQTWNLDPSIRYETPLYYLNFKKEQKRVSYATSFGSWVNFFPTREKELLPWIQQFEHLSMREKSGVEMLKSRGIDCEWVLDPTLLLSSNEYDLIARERLIPEPYVLLFSWNGAKEAVEMAKLVSKKLGCKAYYIVPPPRAMFCGIERKLDIGPKEFLSLIKYAEFVVSNSFHGTVFSIIYKKHFISPIKDVVDPRRASLMQQLGLENHLMTPCKLDLNTIFTTDFRIVDERLKTLREHSQSYLYNAILS